MKTGGSLLVVLVATTIGTVDAATIHSERSLYQTILVTRVADQVCLKFSVRSNERNQSCKDLRRPRRLVFGYTRMMLASLLLQPAPERILVVGLGGGSLPTVLSELFPDAAMDVVEIDPAVVRVAKAYFGFTPSTGMHVHEMDARVFGKRAARRGAHYDLILLDAFNGDYIPEHLLTREYLTETRRLLATGGVLAANTFAISALYDHESVTYESVFGRFLNFKMPDSANRVVLVRSGPLPSQDALTMRAKALAKTLAPYGVPIARYPGRMSSARDWDTEVRVLTDQYAPANLLNAPP